MLSSSILLIYNKVSTNFAKSHLFFFLSFIFSLKKARELSKYIKNPERHEIVDLFRTIAELISIISKSIIEIHQFYCYQIQWSTLVLLKFLRKQIRHRTFFYFQLCLISVELNERRPCMPSASDANFILTWMFCT